MKTGGVLNGIENQWVTQCWGASFLLLSYTYICCNHHIALILFSVFFVYFFDPYFWFGWCHVCTLVMVTACWISVASYPSCVPSSFYIHIPSEAECITEKKYTAVQSKESERHCFWQHTKSACVFEVPLVSFLLIFWFLYKTVLSSDCSDSHLRRSCLKWFPA